MIRQCARSRIEFSFLPFLELVSDFEFRILDLLSRGWFSRASAAAAGGCVGFRGNKTIFEKWFKTVKSGSVELEKPRSCVKNGDWSA
jgi:hypothetical protein